MKKKRLVISEALTLLLKQFTYISNKITYCQQTSLDRYLLKLLY